MARRSAAVLQWRQPKPAWGWQARPDTDDRTLVNPRSPAVPAKLAEELTLEGYCAIASLPGILSAQRREPNEDWVCDKAMRLGVKMAALVRQQQRPQGPKRKRKG